MQTWGWNVIIWWGSLPLAPSGGRTPVVEGLFTVFYFWLVSGLLFWLSLSVWITGWPLTYEPRGSTKAHWGWSDPTGEHGELSDLVLYRWKVMLWTMFCRETKRPAIRRALLWPPTYMLLLNRCTPASDCLPEAALTNATTSQSSRASVGLAGKPGPTQRGPSSSSEDVLLRARCQMPQQTFRGLVQFSASVATQ